MEEACNGTLDQYHIYSATSSAKSSVSVVSSSTASSSKSTTSLIKSHQSRHRGRRSSHRRSSGRVLPRGHSRSRLYLENQPRDPQPLRPQFLPDPKLPGTDLEAAPGPSNALGDVPVDTVEQLPESGKKTWCQKALIVGLSLLLLLVCTALIVSVVLLVQYKVTSILTSSATTSNPGNASLSLLHRRKGSHGSRLENGAQSRTFHYFSKQETASTSTRAPYNNSEAPKSVLLKSGKAEDSSFPSIDVEDIYTAWSGWTKCRKQCRQMRKRLCKVPDICGQSVMKEARPCHSNHRCRKRKQTSRNRKGSRRRASIHIVKRKKLSRRTRGMLKYNRAFYSKWSQWASCTDTCQTVRSKECKFSLVCGANKVHEEAYCYNDGSDCETWYKQGKSLRHAERYRAELAGEDLSSTLNNLGPNSEAFDALGESLVDPLAEKRLPPSSAKGDGQDDPFDGQRYQCGQHISVDGQGQLREGNRPWALKIIGGREAVRGRWPWQVAILNKYREVFCGGTLVAPGWVLTAAHCVRKHLFVRLGEHDLVENEGSEQEFAVKTAIMHPLYNPDTVDNDIALLRVPITKGLRLPFGQLAEHENPFRSDPPDHGPEGPGEVPPFPTACLPNQEESLPHGTHCVILGWGKEKSSHIYGTDVLQEAEIPIVSDQECTTVYKDYYISRNMFCAGYRTGRIDTCAGDSGGPLLCQKNGLWTIYGVTSFGEGCGQEGKYGIYAKVPNYVEWIKSVVQVAM